MAIAFELVINYGQAQTAADDARRLVLAHPPLTAGPHRIQLHEPMLRPARYSFTEPYLEMAIVPARVGFGVALDGHQSRLPLTATELSELGHGLYTLLAMLTGYRAARVGWDPEGYVDLSELRHEWAEELAEGALPGLVLADDIDLGIPAQALTPFAPGFMWIRYQGEQNSTLTAGET